METFLTVNKNDYKWPYPKPFNFKPAQPPLTTKPKGVGMRRPLAAYCHCDSHQYDMKLNQYKELTEKEKILFHDLYKLQKKTTQLNNDALDHPCDDDEDKMKTIFQTAFAKRNVSLPIYRKLVPSKDSKAKNPFKLRATGMQNGYRDATSFRYNALNRPHIDPAGPVTFTTTPAIKKNYYNRALGSSNYQDYISTTGAIILKSAQQFREPFPSSRRRFGDPCL